MQKSKSRKPNTVTLARALSKLGFCSRSQATQLIEDGQVLVDGSVVRNPAKWVDLSIDKIKVSGKAIPKKQFVYIVMNKPKGVVTTRSDEKNRKTVYDFLEGVEEWVFPVGRLDINSSGLLFLTNDNQLGDRMTNPQSKVPKTYHVQLDHQLSDRDKAIIQKGMLLDGEQLLPAKIHPFEKVKGEFWVEIAITEGKNRQIRRMFETLKYSILELSRISIGGYTLEGLKEGEWKYLTTKEVEKFA